MLDASWPLKLVIERLTPPLGRPCRIGLDLFDPTALSFGASGLRDGLLVFPRA